MKIIQKLGTEKASKLLLAADADKAAPSPKTGAGAAAARLVVPESPKTGAGAARLLVPESPKTGTGAGGTTRRGSLLRGLVTSATDTAAAQTRAATAARLASNTIVLDGERLEIMTDCVCVLKA